MMAIANRTSATISRAKRVREVHVIGVGLKPGEEAGKAAGGGEASRRARGR